MDGAARIETGAGEGAGESAGAGAAAGVVEGGTNRVTTSSDLSGAAAAANPTAGGGPAPSSSDATGTSTGEAAGTSGGRFVGASHVPKGRARRPAPAPGAKVVYRAADKYWFPYFAEGAGPVCRLSGELLLRVMFYLAPRDLARVAASCKGLQLLPSDNSVWHLLCRWKYKDVSADSGAVGNWKAEFKMRRDVKASEQAYMRSLMYGGAGRRSTVPERLPGPGLSYFQARSSAGRLGTAVVVLDQGPAEEVAQHKGVGKAKPQLSSRQGTMSWSALG